MNPSFNTSDTAHIYKLERRHPLLIMILTHTELRPMPVVNEIEVSQDRCPLGQRPSYRPQLTVALSVVPKTKWNYGKAVVVY